MEEIQAKGPDAPASASGAWSDGWSRELTLASYLVAIEKMIEALASLRDFNKEPLTNEEEADLNEIWLMENTPVKT